MNIVRFCTLTFSPVLIAGCGLFLPTTTWFYVAPEERVNAGSEFRYEKSFLTYRSGATINDESVLSGLLFGLEGGMFENHPCPKKVEVTDKGTDLTTQVFWIEGRCEK